MFISVEMLWHQLVLAILYMDPGGIKLPLDAVIYYVRAKLVSVIISIVYVHKHYAKCFV